MNYIFYIHKIYAKYRAVGLANLYCITKNKITKNWFYYRFRTKALHHTANHTWEQIAKKHGYNMPFHLFLKKRKNNSLLPKHLLKTETIKTPTSAKIFNTLYRLDKNMPWHTDFLLQKNSTPTTFPLSVFFADISIPSGKKNTLEKDIKIPWELSRFHYIQNIGAAYTTNKDPFYQQLFTELITEWKEKNPYLLGINWICPMEVGIRAINWIVGFHYFKSTPISTEFWKIYICSLYDHLYYLENNWEIYDTITSNHYLSDLLGYFYLALFFKELPGFEKKITWCHATICSELCKQIQCDGSSYEGSTAYHRLITEIAAHFFLLCQEHSITILPCLQKRIEDMMTFLSWCTISDDHLVRIGDDDSGSIVNNIYIQLAYKHLHNKKATNKTVRTFQNFGITIIKTKNTHSSLRSHAYTKRQPSGHFHNDALSLTLAYNAIPLIVDPGTYVYTASTPWRNYFRSIKQHNTFFLDNKEPIPFGSTVFSKSMPEASFTDTLHETKNYITLYSSHNLYRKKNLKALRTLILEKTTNKIILIDQWQPLLPNQPLSEHTSSWNFTLAPEIYPQKTNSLIYLVHKDKPIAIVKSTLSFSLDPGWFSPYYHHKEKTVCLRSSIPLQPYKKNITTFEPV